ncbi:MAG TPA: biotin--[acetyl-CoA-carboxylase] ligase [Burkholderiales bacterium]|nr:biotin--[acetyl-CoA-carboxylase] ligase [Burkholderiales bacterium]
MDRLDAAAIALPGVEVRVVERCASTNSVLLNNADTSPVLLAAEEQTAGRGRRGRRWHSAPGAGVTFSLARSLNRPAREAAGLPLVAGVAVARALRGLGATRAALKWPNDLVAAGAKLGGILVETRSQGHATRAVIGIGLNCRHDAGLELRLRRKLGALDQFIGRIDRNQIIARVARSLLDALDEFEAKGLDSARRDWEAMDAHAGQRLRVRLADGRVLTGVASGLDADGGLRLATRAGLRLVRSGRVVSTRPA